MGVTFSSIYYRLFGRKELRIVMFGLDNAGKTTILYRLKLGEVVSTIPTIGFNVETVAHKNINLTVWDVGAGGDKMRPLWFHYVEGSQAIIFVVDSTDRERIDEAEYEIRSLLYRDGTENIVLLVIANKQDVANAMTQDEVTHRLRLNELAHRKWHVQLTSATEGYGLNEALDWLVNELDS